MRKVLVELEQKGFDKNEHIECAGKLGEELATITGEADVYAPHTKIVVVAGKFCHTCIIIISTYTKTSDDEKAVMKLITDKRKELLLFEIRFDIVDEV